MSNLQLHRDYNKMVYDLAKPGDQILHSLKANDCHIIHMLLGCCGELMEIELGYYKLMNANQFAVLENWTEQDWLRESVPIQKNINEEIGDFQFFFIGLAQGLQLKYDFEIDLLSLEYKASEAAYFQQDFENLFDLCKKALMYQKTIEPEVMKKALEMAYLSSSKMVNAYSPGANREFFLEGNMEKLLKGRYKTGKYSDDQAIERADKNGEC